MINKQYKDLPKKVMGAGALILNEKNEVLLVKPSYKDHWSIAGGIVDEKESPKETLIREVKEEIGLDLQEAKFLSIDYVSNYDDRGDNLQLIFFGGVLNEAEIKNIKVDGQEIVDYKFVKIDEVGNYSNHRTTKRLIKSFEALKNNIALYLEDGK